MKKRYVKPSIEMEVYELDASIAGNCGIVVDNGPAMGSHEVCESDAELAPFGAAGIATFSTRPIYNIHFYEDTDCDCYTTGSDNGYWTS